MPGLGLHKLTEIAANPIFKAFIHSKSILCSLNILEMRVVKHWPRLPREVVDVPSLQTFKARLDGALSNLI